MQHGQVEGRDLRIERMALDALEANPRNARTHSRRQIRQIAASLKAFGFVNPVLIDESNRIIAGHGRLAAARQLALSEVPAIRIAGLTEPQKRALALADNKLAENAGWNPEVLAQELRYLSEVELDFEAEITGFSSAEIDLLIEGADGQADDKADRIPAPPEGPAWIRQGDLWRLGEHRLLCGDATRAGDYENLLGRRRARMVFTDPPYNVPIDGHVCGTGRIRHRNFVMASGEMSPAAFTAFLETALGHMARFSLDGAIHFVCMDWRHMAELLAAGRSAYSELKNLCVWNKTNAGLGSLYRSKHELVFVYKSGSAAHINNVELGRNGRNRTNVWDYPGLSSLGRNRDAQLALHPTVKPIALVADAIRDCSRRGEIVLDPFLGSGTTVLAAERTGRRAHALELDPRYAETAIRRWQEETGETARLAPDGEVFRDVRAARLAGLSNAPPADAPPDPASLQADAEAGHGG